MATQRLREYIVKGFVLDDERLKNPDQPFDYSDILDHAGKISHQMAKELAEAEYDKFHQQRLQMEARKADEDDFQQLARKLEEKRKDHSE